MFGVDFSELMVIMVVALIVIGPERLPKLARTAGHLWGRAQRYVNGVKADISRDMAIDEFRKLQEEVQKQAGSVGEAMQQATQSVQSELKADLGQTKLPNAAGGAGAVLAAEDVTAAAQAAPVSLPKKNICAIVDSVRARALKLDDDPEFQALSPAEQEAARELNLQEEKIFQIRNKAYQQVSAAEQAAQQAAKNPDQQEVQSDSGAVQSAQTIAQPVQPSAEHNKFAID